MAFVWSRRFIGFLVLSFAALSLFAGEDITPGCRLPPHTPTTAPKELVGEWNTVFPAEGSAAVGQILGMQTVHNLILPSGKVLMVSGSSWRNKDLKPSDYWPVNPSPPTPTGAFNRMRNTGPLDSGKISVPRSGATRSRITAVNARYPAITGHPHPSARSR